MNKDFSHQCVDIYLYSTGLDKRPVALGGGFVCIKNKHKELIEYVESKIKSYPKESE